MVEEGIDDTYSGPALRDSTPLMMENDQRDPAIEYHGQVNIQPLVPILEKKEHFECKITLKCAFNKVIETIVTELGKNPRELEWFKKESPFGHLLDVPTYYQHSSQMTWLLLLRQVKCQHKDEMWFVVNGKPVRFSLLEYVLISGLRSSEYPDGDEEHAKSLDFKKRHFPKHTIVTIGDVERKLGEMGNENTRKRSRKDNGELNMEKIKMPMLLFVSAVLCPGDKSTSGINSNVLGLVDNIDMFVEYPWGKDSFYFLRKQLVKPLKDKAQRLLQDGIKASTMSYNGFAFPLAILVYECIPAIARVYAHRRENIASGTPRICHWHTTWKSKQAPTYGDIMRALDKSQDITGLLTPTDQELQAPHMRGYIEMSDYDCGEDELDVIYRELRRQLVSGRSITWHDDSIMIPDPDHAEDVEARVPTNVVEHTIETCVRRNASPIIDVADIGNMREYNEPSPPRRHQPEGTTTETPFWVNELKSYLDHKISTSISTLEINLGQKICKVEENLQRLEGKVDSLMVAKVVDNEQEGASYVDGGDNALYYMTPVRSNHDDIGDGNDLVDIERNANVEVEARPKRKRTLSKNLMTPYTNPFRKPRYGRNENLMHDPLRPVPTVKRKSFLKYMKESKSNETIPCGIDGRNKGFFEEVKKNNAWLSSEHMDEAMFGIRKRQQKFGDIIAQDVVVLDEEFGQLVSISYHSKLEEEILDTLLPFVHGQKPKEWGKSWEGAKKVYFPLNVSSNHWVAIRIDLETMEVTVFDSYITLIGNEIMEDAIMPFCTLIPNMLKLSGQFEHIAQHLDRTWTYTRRIDVPQQSGSSDCGIYAIKFIELDMANEELSRIKEKPISFYREKLAVDIFWADWDP